MAFHHDEFYWEEQWRLLLLILLVSIGIFILILRLLTMFCCSKSPKRKASASKYEKIDENPKSEHSGYMLAIIDEFDVLTPLSSTPAPSITSFPGSRSYGGVDTRHIPLLTSCASDSPPIIRRHAQGKTLIVPLNASRYRNPLPNTAGTPDSRMTSFEGGTTKSCATIPEDDEEEYEELLSIDRTSITGSEARSARYCYSSYNLTLPQPMPEFQSNSSGFSPMLPAPTYSPPSLPSESPARRPTKLSPTTSSNPYAELANDQSITQSCTSTPAESSSGSISDSFYVNNFDVISSAATSQVFEPSVCGESDAVSKYQLHRIEEESEGADDCSVVPMEAFPRSISQQTVNGSTMGSSCPTSNYQFLIPPDQEQMFYVLETFLFICNIIAVVHLHRSQKNSELRIRTTFMLTCSVLCDFTIGVLVNPILFFPIPGGFATGFFTYFLNIKTSHQIVISYTVVTTMILSMLILSEYKHYILLPFFSPIKLETKWRVVLFSMQLPYLYSAAPLIVYLLSCDQNSLKTEILRRMSCIPPEFNNNAHFFVIGHMNITFYLYLVWLLTMSSQIILHILHAFYIVARNKTKIISRVTLQMHRRALYSLAFQVSIPCVICLFPCFYLLYSIMFTYYNQTLNDIAMKSVSLHGTVTIITTLILETSKTRKNSIKVKPHQQAVYSSRY